MAVTKFDPALLKRQEGHPPIYKNVADMAVIIDKYLAENNNMERPPTMSGLACALHMDRMSLVNYSKKDEYFITIKQARRFVESIAEQMLLTKKTSAIGNIFSLKNNFGWRDDRQIEVRHFGINDIIKQNGTPVLDGELVDDTLLLDE